MKVTIYNKTLNPQFWFDNKTLKPEIRTALLKIAQTFFKEIELKVHIRDIYFLGSTANYNWTPTSDVDLHLLIDFNDLPMPGSIAKSFTKMIAKKWNEEQDVSIKSHNVEVYIQDISEENRATGVYSLMLNKWVKEATPQHIVLDKTLIQQKYTTWVQRIKHAISSQNVDKLKKVMEDLIKMRETGLVSTGEFSTENLVFKIIRQRGLIGQLKTAIQTIKNKNLSLKEVKIPSTAYFWMDMNAKLYKVPLFGHKKYANDYLKLNIPDSDVSLRGDLYDKMFDFGFVRIVVDGSSLSFEYSKKTPPTNLQMKELKDMAVENALWLWDGTRARNVDVDENLLDGFDPSSFGPNVSVDDPNYYNNQILKMKKM